MLEMKNPAPGEVVLREDGQEAGGAVWTWGELCWGRERAKVARFSRWEASEQNAPALWAYLEFLWEGMAVAAAQMPDGSLKWYHKALEKSWRSAGGKLDWATGFVDGRG